MTFIHGKDTVILLKTATTAVTGANISAYTNASELEQSADAHKVTGYGKTAHVKQGGLKDGKFTMSGTYDNTASVAPRALMNGKAGETMTIWRRPEGTGTSKAQDKFDAVLVKYAESNPVADMVTWSAEFEVSDEVITTPQ